MHPPARNPRYLDPSHPAVLQKVTEDTKRFTEDWGYQLIKHDFSTCDIFGFWGFQRIGFWAEDGWHFFDETKTSAEIIVQFYRTIYESAAPGTVILGCNVIGHLAAGLVHLNRTGDDTRFVSCQPDQAKGQIEADLREAFRLSADQQDTLIPLDLMENP